ncbi:hypothetical protein ANCCAN_26657 [Ancylostoma caninum]|uniref:Uncharacterized protein n=1 Tax=Ancylostoma caninum TaxID=29170 RepID=A0A368F7Q2_ANCCA|nr:hypothetical protein ANCCAN_26657 [Ancylostoma caninum]
MHHCSFVRRLSNRIIEASDGLSKGLELLTLNCETTKDEGECNLEDAELVRLKNTFSEGLEYLRNFQPDADELFNRKVRFSAGEDAARLPQSIATCGELCVLMPQFAGRYLPLEQSYLPRPFRLPLESDQHRARHEDARANDRDRPSSRITWVFSSITPSLLLH